MHAKDLLQPMFLLGDTFSVEAKKRNFEFYDPLTTGDSSLSSCVEAIIAAQIGDIDKAIRYGMAALLTDLADVSGNVRDGCHIASTGGTWMMRACRHADLCGLDGLSATRSCQARASSSPVRPMHWSATAIVLDVANSLVRRWRCSSKCRANRDRCACEGGYARHTRPSRFIAAAHSR